MAATMIFGSFTHDLLGKAMSTIHSAVTAEKDIFSSIKERLERKRHGKICRMKNGSIYIKAASSTKVEKINAAAKKLADDKAAFLKAQPTIVDKIIVNEKIQVVEAEEVHKREDVQTVFFKKTKKRAPKLRATCSRSGLDNLYNAVANIAKASSLRVEVIHKKRVCGEFKQTRFGRALFIDVAHAKGHRRRIDCRMHRREQRTMHMFMRKTTKTEVRSKHLRKGDSGIVLLTQKIKGHLSGVRDEFFIVRGTCDDSLLEARARFSQSITLRATHFSTGDIFWKGFNASFQEQKAIGLDHTCTSDLPVEACGHVAALMCQSLFPCGKITCKRCIANLSNLDFDTFSELQGDRAMRILDVMRARFPSFTHTIRFLHDLFTQRRVTNPNTAAFREILRLIGDRNEAPFAHVNRLNEILLLGSKANPDSLAKASDSLLELARYLNNRTENIRNGSLKHFRNKISSKAHSNLALSCDNQLDQNGNFVWGLRGIAAKRFLNNYFETIDPEQGYDKYVIRKNPNGERKLAIGNFIISTNLEKLRDQLEGESIARVGITEECVSRKDGNYRYPCCCVTLEDGSPMYSELKMPTKNHLVIGNSGDPKYLDLPGEISNLMYIAKEGYCYINIFLAMLVNVDEANAKDFTKRVRDESVQKLGKWPSLIDVATECALLSTYYPAAASAELPRLLVDHAQKTIHVVDSYGSLNTGYHILKANTVSQLEKFASNTLESPMAQYKVGGLVYSENNDASAVKALTQAIFRPDVLSELIEKEPYLMVFALVSPGILMAMSNSGALEFGISKWISSDHSLVRMASILKTLASKVSVAETLALQKHIMRQNANFLCGELINGFQKKKSYTHATRFLLMISEENEMDDPVLNAGYRVLEASSHEIMEKTYLALLETSWSDLSLYGKFKSIWFTRKHFGRYKAELFPKEQTDLQGRYSNSLRFHYQSTLKRLRNKGSLCRERFLESISSARRRTTCAVFSLLHKAFPDVLKFINTLVIVSLSMQIYYMLVAIIQQHRAAKIKSAQLEERVLEDKTMLLYDDFKAKLPEGSFEEFLEYTRQRDKEVYEYLMMETTEIVEFQAKNTGQASLERIIAFVSLTLMLFDNERSDCVYKILTKFKGILGSVENNVRFQSLDTIVPTQEEKNMVIDFELDSDTAHTPQMQEQTFSDWWSNQIANNRVVPHYRTEGYFMQFTRNTASAVSHQIAHNEHKDIILMGAVGSGKSTGLPTNLCKFGGVLLLEPTRPLAENVTKQMRGSPFFASPTLRMRNLSTFGSSPITVMTTGFALHFFANNVKEFDRYQFIIFDEFHVLDSNAIAFRNLCHEYSYNGKIIKVSATPPGRECDLTTQYPVELLIEEQLSLRDFVDAQGTDAHADVVKKGDNILVYVASYNEVDQLSKMLNERGFLVTKVDGRTMKLGGVEIITKGSSIKKHFIVATNIIENGVTLDVDVVVDFGLKVVPNLDSDNRLVSYCKIPISLGERIQRFGRVGRNKPGVALRIGETIKGLVEIPSMIATEAAFLCFVYGLPVTTQNVSTSILSQVSVRQARVMCQFELPIFYTAHLVRYDGAMHPAIHNALKRFKLRDSEINLNTLAIPTSSSKTWYTGKCYKQLVGRLDIPDEIKIPFYTKEVPEKVHEQIWDVMVKFSSDAGFGRMTSAAACKVAYTLQTDIHSIQRTVQIIDRLLENEMKKRSHFNLVVNQSCSSHFMSLSSIMASLRAHYAKNHTGQNIEILQKAKAQLLEFSNLAIDPSTTEALRDFGYLEAVRFQSESEMARGLKLSGHWKWSLISRDLIVVSGVGIGLGCMLWQFFKEKMHEPVKFQGKSRRRLQFRKARDDKMGYIMHGEGDTIEHFFGAAYTKKGKSKGKTHGAGTKAHKFVNMYGVSPDEYSYVRYLDPVTGATLDESPMTDLNIVQEHFGEIRREAILADAMSLQQRNKGIQAYFVRNSTMPILKVDLTPHIPLKVCESNNIAGFPEREGELRRTGPTETLPFDALPPEKQEVAFESKALLKGVRDFNPISACVCLLENSSDGHSERLFGIGFGPYIIANQHLFRRNNGELTIKTMHGEFKVKNSTQLQMKPVEGRDIIVIKMAKDFPPFPQKLKFRQPTIKDRVCMVSTNFQQKSVSSLVSESSHIVHKEDTSFWQHWITTKDGQCGSPLVSIIDGNILGIHSLTHTTNGSNYFVEFPEKFVATYLDAADGWCKNWKFNADKISWGSFTLVEDAPEDDFMAKKTVAAIMDDLVRTQGEKRKWMLEAAHTNIQPVAHLQSQLVTKHIVKGRCKMFALYLQENADARDFFKSFMGAYGPSHLNKEAYIKDIMKYSKQIVVGSVDCDTFESSLKVLSRKMKEWGFENLEYVTDEQTIKNALNMDAAVGALYSGKKKQYFEDLSDDAVANLVQKSCLRLFKNKLGVWNGSLKAELRPFEKLIENKTRTFTAAPIETLLGGKVCVDDFNNHFYSKHIQCPWSVGMTKFYGGWNELLGKLPDGWVYCDADGSQFDSSLSPYLINAVLRLRLSSMEEWDVGQKMLQNLYTEIVYTPISTPDGTIVKKFKGNNSGQPSTVVDNTLMVVLAMYYALSKLGVDINSQEDVCKFFANGDDLIIAISPELEHVLDGFQQHFSDLGLNYDFSSRTRDKKELWFMSHRALSKDGILIPKLEPERIVSILEWDRSAEPHHRLEAICASMIEAWGYTDLLQNIRRFYKWTIEQEPYRSLAEQGLAPYLSEVALRRLYTSQVATDNELTDYYKEILANNEFLRETVRFQSDTVDAGKDKARDQKLADKPTLAIDRTKDKDVNTGTSGTFSIPRLKKAAMNMKLPKVGGSSVVNLDHLLTYKPAQEFVVNTRATHSQFKAWHTNVMAELELNEEQMKIVLNGFMIWCIENGTSPNISGVWTMMDGDEQVEYPIEPMVKHANPSLRQIMKHFSNLAEAYIRMRNSEQVYIPRYGLQRGLVDRNLAPFAFDFFEVNGATPVRAREAHAQMKAAALRNSQQRMFCLDGSVSGQEENTERHTVDDVNAQMHHLLGVKGV
nr:polyprotein [Tobacco vein mottling virus]